MKKKLLKSLRVLLVAAGLCVGASAWAGILTPTAGLADNSTAWNTWDESFTQNYTMSGNGTATFTFHYTADVSASDYAGWTFFIGKTINTTNVWDTWITCQGFSGGFYGADGLAGTRASSNTFSGTLSAASCTEADVVMTVTRADGVITAVAAVDPTDGSDDYTITWTYTYGGSEDATADLYLSFAVEKAYLSISNVTGAGIITTTQADINFTNDIADGAIAGTLNSISITSGTTTETERNATNNSLKLGKSTSTVTIPAAIRAGSRDKVTISFDLGYGKLTNRSVFFNAKDADGTAIFDVTYNVYSNSFSSNTLGISGDDFYHGYNTVLWDRRATYTIVIDYNANTISTSVKNNYGGGVTNHQVTLGNSNPVATFNIGSNYDSNPDRRCEASNIKITTTLGDYSASEVSYIVKFVDGNGNTVKADDTSRESLAGTAISDLASLTDKATFYNDDDIANNAVDEFVGATNKYNYRSISAVNSSLETITELEAGAIVTIVYDKYNKYDYAVKQKLGDAEATDKETGTLWGDEEFSCYFPKGIKSGDDYYFTDADASFPYFKATVTAANPTKTINYTIEPSVVFYSEGEDLESKTGTFGAYASISANGSCGVLNDENGNLVTSLSAGIYTITARTAGRGDGNRNIYFYKSSVDEGNIVLTANPGNYTARVDNSDAFALTEATDILVKGAEGGGQNGRGLDYVIITKLPDNVSVTVTSIGYATFCNADYNLDFSSATDIEACKASVDA